MEERFGIDYYPQPYCKIINLTVNDRCFERNILELWGLDGRFPHEQEFRKSTLGSILEKLKLNQSQVFNHNYNFSKLLGGVEYDSSGNILRAKATIMYWFTRINTTTSSDYKSSRNGDIVDEESLDFELKLLEVFQDKSLYPPGLESYANVQRSAYDVMRDHAYRDSDLLGIGYVIVFIFVQTMLSQRINLVEHRCLLSVCGIACIGMGVAASYGFCSLLGLVYTPPHKVLPFLFLGFGIDDMFVIVQCWNNMSPEEAASPHAIKFAHTMKKAGVAITITSLTDMVAFSIGSLTAVPALTSFCTYACVGIFTIFVFQSTVFVAAMSLDQKRIEAQRDGLFPWIVRQTTVATPNATSVKIARSKRVFGVIGQILTTLPCQILVLMTTIGFFCVCMYGNLMMEQEFDPSNLFPTDSYLARHIRLKRQHFPDTGEVVTVYFRTWSNQSLLPDNFEILDSVIRELESSNLYVKSVNSWHDGFMDFVNDEFANEDDLLPKAKLNSTFFNEKLSQYLFTKEGSKFKGNFWFEEPLECGKPSPKILLFSSEFTHNLFNKSREKLGALHYVKDVLNSVNISHGDAFAMSRKYGGWETDDIIAKEMFYNIGTATVCIFFVTLLMLNSFITSLIVMICVILTLVNVGGFMYFLGLTIDVVSCNTIIVSVGLCVDFSVHVAHTFMVQSGTRRERVQKSLTEIGPAVMNGGLSTLFAFSMLIFSKSYVFKSFFKIFSLIVGFGLYNGLLSMPVILSVIGPPPHGRIEDSSTQQRSVSVIEDHVNQEQSPNAKATKEKNG